MKLHSNAQARLGRVLAAAACGLCCVPALGDDWTNSGGNAGRNGRTAELGPDDRDVLWTGGRSSIISWLPVIEGRRLFIVRQTGFPPEPNSDASPVVAYDLDTGAELWHYDIPFETGDWTTWIAGAKNGRVFAARSGNGASVSARLYALDAATGGFLWTSDVEIDAGAYDGVVFAEDGDPIIASFRKIWRIDAETGDTVWMADRLCSVSGNCGGAVHDGAVYVVDAVVGGHAIRKFDLATGAFAYNSPVMPGFLVQNTPMVGPDGTVYFHRVQNNATVDFFYAFADTGTGFTERWNHPGGYTTSSEFTVGNDGSVYMWAPGNVVRRLDGATGAVLNESPMIAADFAGLRMATDRDGRVYVSNGAFSNGRLFCFTPDLVHLWTVAVPSVNIGGPAIGVDGTLVLASTSNIRVYRTPRPVCQADLSGSSDPNDPAYGQPDGMLDASDFFYYLDQFASGNLSVADISGSSDPNDPAYGQPDGNLDASDFFYYLDLFVAGCP